MKFPSQSRPKGVKNASQNQVKDLVWALASTRASTPRDSCRANSFSTARSQRPRQRLSVFVHWPEKLITFAKKGDLAARREVLTRISNKSVVHTLFTDIAPRFVERNGGYTRITKIGPRKGDNAPMAVIEVSYRWHSCKEGPRC